MDNRKFLTLEDGRSQRLPHHCLTCCRFCGQEGWFNVQFFGALEHPGCSHGAHSWYLNPFAYAVFQIQSVAVVGSHGASFGMNDVGKRESGSWLYGIFGFCFAAGFRLMLALVLIPIQAVVALASSRLQATTAAAPSEPQRSGLASLATEVGPRQDEWSDPNIYTIEGFLESGGLLAADNFEPSELEAALHPILQTPFQFPAAVRSVYLYRLEQNVIHGVLYAYTAQQVHQLGTDVAEPAGVLRLHLVTRMVEAVALSESPLDKAILDGKRRAWRERAAR
mgnify:CR=1 FL=1